MLNLYIIHDYFKKNDSKMFRILLWETDWLTSYFRMTRLCYPHSFENVYKTLINIAETCFLPAKRASNIITLTAKVLSPNFWYKKVPTKFSSWKLFTSQKQVISVAIRKVILNWLEDLLALNICAQGFSMAEIIMESFKTEQNRTKWNPWQHQIIIGNQLRDKRTIYKKTAILNSNLGRG